MSAMPRLLKAGRLVALLGLGLGCTLALAVFYVAYCILVALVRLWFALAHGGMAWARGAERVISAMVAWYYRKIG